ncbi:MAG: hypothetical protein ACP5E3_10070 [Bacteroidales bacterium]
MLNIDQIENIEKQVQKAEISFSHLADDLVDHICCDVENRMNNGESFDQAFAKVKDKIGIEGLKNIQEQTLLIINQNYLIMKKALYVLSVSIVFLLVLSGVFKIFHLPGASLLLFVAFIGLIVGFIPLLFLTRNKEDSDRKQVWVNLSGYLASTVFLLSILWTIMHWPGRIWLVVFSWILILGFFLPSFLGTILKNRNDGQRLTNIGVVLLIVLLLVMDMVFSFNSKRSAYTQQDVVVNNLPEMTAYFDHQNEILYKILLDDSTLNTQTRRSILLLKEASMEFESELISLAMDIDRLNDFNSLRLKDKKPDDFELRVEKIRQLSDNYRQSLKNEFSLTEDLVKLVDRTCDTRGTKEASIYDLYFTKPAVMIRNNLYRLNRDVLLIENELLEHTREQI